MMRACHAVSEGRGDACFRGGCGARFLEREERTECRECRNGQTEETVQRRRRDGGHRHDRTSLIVRDSFAVR